MNQGIYIYTFANGDNYIGQAIDIENRCNQHFQKMQKGQHTKLIQAAYNRYGFPRVRVLVRCHPHYLDALESMYIFNIKPQLNGNRPAHYITQSREIKLEQDIISNNLYDNIIELQRLRVEEQENLGLIEELEQECKRLEKRVLTIAKESQPKELNDYLNELENTATLLADQLKISEAGTINVSLELKNAKERIAKHNALPWYKRIFHTV